ncbi:MAG: 4-hydroxy-tetrahydrodipicolinate reductase [Nitrospinota bacterium]
MRVAVAGAAGRMGCRIIHQIAAQGDMSLACALERPGLPALGGDAGANAGVGPLQVALTSDEGEVAGDVLISFATPEASAGHARLAAAKGMAAVIGTTGLSPEQRQAVAEAARKVPIVLSPNMSVGVNVAFKLIEEAARLLGEAYDAEILEAHHNQKVDAPSGTAVRMGEIVARALGRSYPGDAVFHREGQTGKRPPRAIGMQTLRGGDVAGEHTVYFFGMGERVEITHRASSRDNFAAGAIRAARWVVKQPPALYGMAEVLGL